MKRSTGILLILIALEAVVCGVVVVRRLQRPAPVLPRIVWDDPLIAEELEDLARAARSGSSEDWEQLAGAYLDRGLWSLAEIHFQQALALDPGNHAARFGLATCIDRTGRVQESTRAFQQLVQRIGNRQPLLSLYSRYQIGLNYLQREKMKRAEETFRRSSGYPPAKYQLTKLLVRSGRFEEAIPMIQDTLRQTPRSMKYLFLKYRAMKALDRPAEAWRAADLLQRSVKHSYDKLGRTHTDATYQSLGLEKIIEENNALIQQGNMDLLASNLEGILDMFRGRRSPYVKLTMGLLEAELRRKNPRRMRALVERMHEFGVYNAELLWFGGAAAVFSGDVETAIDLWRRAVRMSPSVQLHVRLAEAFQVRGEADRRDFHIARSLVLRGLTLYRENRVREAAKVLQRALELNADDAQAWFYLAQSRRVMGQPSQARTAYQRCLELRPNHGRARRQLGRLVSEESIVD